MLGSKHRKLRKTKKKILVRPREKNGKEQNATHCTLRRQLAVHLLGTNTEKHTKLTDRDVLKIDKKKNMMNFE